MVVESVEDEELRVCKISVEDQDEADRFIGMPAGQLAMLPVIADLQPGSVNIDDAKISNGALNDDQVPRVKETPKKDQRHLIGGGNALLNPAGIVVCNLDAREHPPISFEKPIKLPEAVYIPPDPGETINTSSSTTSTSSTFRRDRISRAYLVS